MAPHWPLSYPTLEKGTQESPGGPGQQGWARLLPSQLHYPDTTVCRSCHLPGPHELPWWGWARSHPKEAPGTGPAGAAPSAVSTAEMQGSRLQSNGNNINTWEMFVRLWNPMRTTPTFTVSLFYTVSVANSRVILTPSCSRSFTPFICGVSPVLPKGFLNVSDTCLLLLAITIQIKFLYVLKCLGKAS